MDIKSYEELLEECLKEAEKVMDTREGSLAYIISSAYALQIAELYTKIKDIENNAFPLTSRGEYLDMAVELVGLERKAPTKAVVKIESTEKPLVGDEFIGGDNQYKAIDVYDGYFYAECKTAGTKGNFYFGEVIPLSSDMDGDFVITQIVAAGEAEESDESLRERFTEHLTVPMFVGNVAYYKNAVDNITGVGSIKVVPAYEGVGTVKVIITDNEFNEASEDLVNYVKEVLDPEETSGLGYGVVPIGHRVLVESVQAVDVDIVCEVEPKEKKDYFFRLARTYLPYVFDEINKTWHKTDNIILRDRVIEDYFLSLGATDINVISMNGEPNRLKMEENQILGKVKFNGT